MGCQYLTENKELKILKRFLKETRFPLSDIFFAIRTQYLLPKLERTKANPDYLSQIRLSIEEAAYTKNIGRMGELLLHENQIEILWDFIEASEINIIRLTGIIHRLIRRGLKESRYYESLLEREAREGYYRNALCQLRTTYSKISFANNKKQKNRKAPEAVQKTK